MATIKQQYAQQVKRITRNINKMLERGYIMSSDVLPKQPKRITKASVRRLRKITPATIAKSSDYAGVLADGDIISGSEAYKLERKASYKQAQETRRTKKKKAERERIDKRVDAVVERHKREREEYQADYERRYGTTVDEDEQRRFEQQRKQQDEQELQRLDTEEDYREEFSQTNLTMQRLNQIIDSTWSKNPQAAERMESVLSRAINELGYRQVSENVADAGDDVLGDAEDMGKYDAGAPVFGQILNHFQTLVTGHAPSAQESAENSESSDQGDYMDELS